MENRNSRIAVLLTPAVFIAIIIVAAYGYFAYSSLFLKGPPGTRFVGAPTLENYGRVLASGSNRYVLFSTLWASVLMSVLTIAIAMPMALVIVRPKRQWVANLVMLAIAVTFLSCCIPSAPRAISSGRRPG